jgi:hypothetical protein
LTFVQNHAKGIVACDFCVVVTATFRLLYGLVVMEQALIIIETSSLASPCGMLAPQTAMGEEEDVQCDSTPTYMRHTVASTCMPGRWTVCIVNRDGEILLHRNMPTTPEIFLNAIAPYRQDLVVAVECLLTWYWLADLCVQEGLACVLGHAQYMQAIHGGKAKHDRLDTQKIAV